MSKKVMIIFMLWWIVSARCVFLCLVRSRLQLKKLHKCSFKMYGIVGFPKYIFF